MARTFRMGLSPVLRTLCDHLAGVPERWAIRELPIAPDALDDWLVDCQDAARESPWAAYLLEVSRHGVADFLLTPRRN